MKIRRTEIDNLPENKARVTLVLADTEDLDDATESISITVEVEMANTLYLKEVQRDSLERALHAIEREIQATKTAPRPGS